MNTSNPGQKLTVKEMTYIALFAVVIAVCAWISIPMVIPFTLQTFAVFLALSLLGGKRGTVSVIIYILLGVIGLPVFSGFKAGIGTLLGPTGGYIFGFILSALIYLLIEHLAGRSYPIKAVSMAAGLILCYAAGTLWFAATYMQDMSLGGITGALTMCVVPYIIPDVVKIALALFLTSRLEKHIKLPVR